MAQETGRWKWNERHKIINWNYEMHIDSEVLKWNGLHKMKKSNKEANQKIKVKNGKKPSGEKGKNATKKWHKKVATFL